MTRGPWKDPQYPDTGCPGGCDASLSCPRPRCVYDDPGWRTRDKRALRDAAIVWRHARGGRAVEIAAEFKVCDRTVYRALEKNRRNQ